MYPTLMQDTNGNQVLVSYQTSPGASWTNSSARITQIEDARGNGYSTYFFTYNNDNPRHLTAIASNINTGENYSISYLAGQSICSPFNSADCVNTAVLRRVTLSTNGTYHEFTYNGSGELTQILLPYKGYLSYSYGTANYPNSVKHREVAQRNLSKDGIASTQYAFSHEASPSASVHQFARLNDPSGVGQKYWTFATSGLAMGLVTQYQGRELPGPVTKVQNDYTWAQDAVGNSYIGSATTTNDPGQSYAAAKKTDQTVDTHGNVTQVKTYDYGNLTTPVRTDNYTYQTSSSYTSLYIFNRLTSSPTTTVSYDEHGLGSTPGDVHEWVTPNTPYRGNATTVTSPAGTQSLFYNFAGGTLSSNVNGVSSSVSTTNATNYSAPSQISVGSLSESMAYNGFLGLTNQTGPNGVSVSIGYDALARPNSTTSPFGATTTNSYSDTSNPPTATTTTNGRWTKTTMDGLGRTTKVETGYSTTTVSVSETEYDSCGCSPTGKMKRTALPHAPGATPIWTTYTYDGIGRTLTSTTAGTETTATTTYLYQGNTVTVTDAAGKWKKYTSNALGQLTQVNEPNPAGGSDYVTTYTYDTLGHLTGVSMPRPSGTQTRTFNYGNPPGAQLLSATNPENGTVSYSYNSDHTLAARTDAKNQQVQYSYDSYKRVTQIRRYTTQGGQLVEDTCQQENYSYDSNPYDGSFSQYTLGRLAAVQYKGRGGFVGATGGCNTTFTEMYSYSQAGAALKKRLRITRMVDYYNSQNADLDAVYTYDNEGRMTSTQYPTYWSIDYGMIGSWKPGPTLAVTYDSMGHLQKLTDQGAQADIISGATYNPAGQLLTTTGVGGAASETRTYNSLGQLTQLNQCANAYCASFANVSYNYSATQNNGKITSETNLISGEQITYAYDSLNRLASASGSWWGQSYTYDGFGNMTNQTVTSGTAPSLSTSYDPATNRQTGECADANGNLNSAPACWYQAMYYDVENRPVGNYGGNTNWAYSYAPGNKRVWRGVWDTNGTQTVDEVTFWGVNGQKLTTYSLSLYYSTFIATPTGSNYYFGGKLIKNATGYVGADRLGSIGKYFPYGQERPSATTDGKEKFATYFRDSETGLDYANARYHQPGMGRFMSPDPYKASAGPKDPGSWNRYAYVGGDPVNYNDAQGTDACFVSAGGCQPVWTTYGDVNACDPQVGYTLAVNAYNDPYWSYNFDQYMMAASSCGGGGGCFVNSLYGGGSSDPGCGTSPGEQPPPQQPSCDIAVYDRPIEALHGLNIPGAKHGYIVFTDQYGDQFFFEGNKDGKRLTAVDTSSGGTALPKDNPSKDHFDGMMSGASECDWLGILQGDASAVNATNTRYHWYGPNSTSVLTYMLNSLPDSSLIHLPWMIGAGASIPGL